MNANKNLTNFWSLPNAQDFLQEILDLPLKAVDNHEIAGLSELMFSYLASKDFFHLKRAVLLIDNPDFDHLHGVSGFDCTCQHLERSVFWQDPCQSLAHLRAQEFDKKVKQIDTQSLFRHPETMPQKLEQIGCELDVPSSQVLTYKTRTGNFGIIYYQSNDDQDTFSSKLPLLKSLAGLLGLCPR